MFQPEMLLNVWLSEMALLRKKMTMMTLEMTMLSLEVVEIV